MQCHSPISIRDPAKDSNKERITVPCGKCVACQSNRRTEWSTRLEQELRMAKSAWFLTITYSDEHLPKNHSINKRDMQLFMKSLRKKVNDKLKYYLCGEYGEQTLRPHYHMILFNYPGSKEKVQIDVMETWNKGFVHIGDVTSKSIKYTLKYMLKQQNDNFFEFVEKPFSLMSKGLGKAYIDKMTDWHHADVSRNYVVKQDGRKERLPRYFRQKIYDEYQRKEQNQRYQELSDLKWSELTQEQKREFFRLENDRKEQKKRSVKNNLKYNSKI